MGVNNQEMPICHFDEDLKKPKKEDKSHTFSKKSLFFVASAVIVLQGFDTAMLWLMGTSQNSNSLFSGDSFMFSAVTFGILKCIYDKFFLKSGKVQQQEAKADEVEELTAEDECQEGATLVKDKKVKDTKFKAPAHSTNTSKIRKQRPMVSGRSEATIWVSSWLRAPALNPNAKKFEPQYSHWGSSTLDSGAPAFVPHATAQKEKQVLLSESGGADAGAVMYRSKHWMNEIGIQEKQPKAKSPEAKKKSTSPDTKEARKKSTSPEPVVLKKNPKASAGQKWQPVEKTVWASVWSDASVAMSM